MLLFNGGLFGDLYYLEYLCWEKLEVERIQNKSYRLCWGKHIKIR